jgi:hypothetical protein
MANSALKLPLDAASFFDRHARPQAPTIHRALPHIGLFEKLEKLRITIKRS